MCVAAAALLAACTSSPSEEGEHAKLPPFLVPTSTTQTAPTAEPPTETTETPSQADITEPPVEYPVGLSVEKYCVCFGPRAQLQVKLKPRIENATAATISISPDKFRLAVVGGLAGPWTPHRNVAGVLTTTQAGTTYTLVPPNANRAAESMGDNAFTWATHWTANELAAGQTFFLPDPKAGDLVFYVPHDASGAAAVEALALLDEGGRVIGWTPWTGWREYADPADF
jgi:hypothetical protein